jgi:hypothetical protein
MPMKAIIIRFFLAIGLLSFSIAAFSQCEILHRIYPDGSMLFFIEPVNFYWTKSMELKGGIVTDKENYYLGLLPAPFPEKPLGHKLKDELELKLSNDSVYHLEHFDTRYVKHDSIMQLLFLINKTMLDDFLNYEVISAKINMKGTEGIRTYVFKLHKSAIREQLSCFLNEQEHKKKK